MPAKKRANPITQETVYRVFYLDSPTINLVKQVREKRGQTMREFVTVHGFELLVR